jgi:branched-chain amino acid transport system substrate-binding protein
MMKKCSKLANIAVVSAMAVSMWAGCGSSAATEGTAAGTGGTEGASAGGSVFRIGGIGPTTGGAAIYGIAVMNAARMAVDKINATGGVNGYPVELNFQDDGHDAEKSVHAYDTLKDWGAQMIVGAVTSTPCIAVAQKSREDNMFQLTPSGTAAECVQYDNAFRVCFADPEQGTEAAQYISENSLAAKVAVLYDSSDVYSNGIYEAFAKEAGARNLEIVSAEAFTADRKTDFSVQLQKAKNAGADLVFLPIYYTEASLILIQAAAMDYTPAFFGCDGMDGILGVENFNTSLAEGLMFLSPFVTDANTDTMAFTAAYEEKFGETPNQFAADGYDAVFILKQALEAGDANPDMSVSDLCEAIKGAITRIEFDGLTGTDITWAANGEPRKLPIAVKIQNGVYTMM